MNGAAKSCKCAPNAVKALVEPYRSVSESLNGDDLRPLTNVIGKQNIFTCTILHDLYDPHV